MRPNRAAQFALMLSALLIGVLMSLARAAFARFAQTDTADLTSFVTRPEIRAPLLKVNLHGSREEISPGFWFVAPYAKVNQEVFPEYFYQACSTGPHIYDAQGSLVWTGACAFRNQNACDFRSFVDENGTEHLSLIFTGYEAGMEGVGAILSSSYEFSELFKNSTPHPLDAGFNMHEYKVIEGGRSALYVITRPERVELIDVADADIKVGWVSNVGFREVELVTGRTIFEWWSFGPDRIALSESTYPQTSLKGPFPNDWNFFHPNSVDKSSEGDYLLSGRFVDTIYKISGRSGSILWRMGGRKSSFVLNGFNFSKQHDAQFLGHSADGLELISLFDNSQAMQHSWLSEATSSTSSCLVIALDHQSMTANLVKRIWRPDGGITALRGNFQHLPNGNTVEAWSENGYMSEHTPDGRLLLEARFASERFVTYRAYKFNFTGHPIEPPSLTVNVYGTSPDLSTTVWYISWNGATEVAKWRFCRETLRARPIIVGTAIRSGFETIFISDGLEGLVYVEAVATNGSVIGRTQPQLAVWPEEWGLELSSVDEQEDDKDKQPHDSRPSAFGSWDKADL